jgi:protein-tyrosine phosphatase
LQIAQETVIHGLIRTFWSRQRFYHTAFLDDFYYKETYSMLEKDSIPKFALLAEQGFVDLHSHLLPGVDDGCRSVADAIECIARLQAAGFAGSVCSPHIWLEEFPFNRPPYIQQWVDKLQEQLTAAGIDYPLWAGGEVRLSPRTIFWFEDFGVPTLGPGPWVLVDYWGHDWPPFAVDAIRYLIDRDYKPILAHPERMNITDAELEGMVRELSEMGVWLQGNLNSMSGGEGSRAQSRMRKLLDEDRYHLIASDLHRPTDVTGRITGIQNLRDILGEDQLRLMLDQRPREILSVA